MTMNARILLLLSLPLLLAGCGTLGSKPEAQSKERGEAAPAKQAPAAKRGGYYLDDGPGDNPPADIDAIPDATPRQEALIERSNRPYRALGETYTPMTTFQPYKARGVASWYGRRYHGQKTSSGEVYDMYAMTAAHPILPIPSYVRVTNPENGRSVVVRVNDRGPFKKERLIDLSYAASYKLRLSGKGSGLVEVEAIDTGSTRTAAPVPAQPSATVLSQPVSSQPLPPQPVPGQPSPMAAEKPLDNTSAASGSFVQAGAFKRKENADQLRVRLKQHSLAQSVGVENWYNDGVYRVRIGPYLSRDEAERAAGRIKQSLGISTLVVTQ